MAGRPKATILDHFADLDDPRVERTRRHKLDFVHLGGAGEDVGELSVNCGWGFSAVGFQPSALYNQAA